MGHDPKLTASFARAKGQKATFPAGAWLQLSDFRPFSAAGVS